MCVVLAQQVRSDGVQCQHHRASAHSFLLTASRECTLGFLTGLELNPISWPSAKLFILPPVYSVCSAARQRLESTRSEGLSPQATQWRLGTSLRGRGWLWAEAQSWWGKAVFTLVFLNRKCRVDSEADSLFSVHYCCEIHIKIEACQR